MRIAALLVFSALSIGCVQTEEQWSIKKSTESAKFEKSFMKGNIADSEGGTQDDVDRMFNKNISMDSNYATSNLDKKNVEKSGFFGARKKSGDGNKSYATNSLEPETWSGTKEFSTPEFPDRNARFAAKDWEPRRDEYYHVGDLDDRSASKRFPVNEYVAAQEESSDRILLGRANERVTAASLREKRDEDPGATDGIATPSVSLEEVKGMLGR
ncbi:MAG: hypothetical protein AAGA58_12470 [Verrucomicrobiota bacterium]